MASTSNSAHEPEAQIAAAWAFLNDKNRVSDFFEDLLRQAGSERELPSADVVKTLRKYVDESNMSSATRNAYPSKVCDRLKRLQRIEGKRRYRIFKRAPRASKGEESIHAQASVPALIPLESQSLHEQIAALQVRLAAARSYKKFKTELERDMQAINDKRAELEERREKVAHELQEVERKLGECDIPEEKLVDELQKMLDSEGARLA